MIIYMLFGQRKCHYEGEYAPELLEACDEYSNGENPEGWLAPKLDEYRETGEFDSLVVVRSTVDGAAVDALLDTKPKTVRLALLDEAPRITS